MLALIENRAESLDAIAARNLDLRKSRHYKNVMRFGDEAMIEKIGALNAAYDNKLLEDKRKKEEKQREQERLKREQQEKEREEKYLSAVSKAESEDISLLKQAISDLSAVGMDYRDAQKYAESCRSRIDALEAAKAKKTKKLLAIALPTLAVCIAAVLLITQVIIPNGKYKQAIALADAGQYEEAIAAFQALNGYKDSAEQIAICRDEIAAERARQEEERKAAAYTEAEALENIGDIVSAYEQFAALGKYKDSADRADNLLAMYKLKKATKGDYVFFGIYEQDNNCENGKESIEWIVLDKKDERLLVISRYALDCQPYNEEKTSVTWATCTLRTWLNKTFLNTAFSIEEQNKIPTVTVNPHKNPEYNTNPGISTQDQVFLLSIVEANRYFSGNIARECVPTAYAIAQGAQEGAKTLNGNIVYYSNSTWWLRSPGFSSALDATNVGYVSVSGNLSYYGTPCYVDVYAIRPALWINLSTE